MKVIINRLFLIIFLMVQIAPLLYWLKMVQVHWEVQNRIEKNHLSINHSIRKIVLTKTEFAALSFGREKKEIWWKHVKYDVKKICFTNRNIIEIYCWPDKEESRLFHYLKQQSGGHHQAKALWPFLFYFFQSQIFINADSYFRNIIFQKQIDLYKRLMAFIESPPPKSLFVI